MRFLLVLLSSVLSFVIAAPHFVPIPTAFVNLRIEGPTSTIFEGWLDDYPLDVTTPSGGTHACNGLNNGANPKEGPTCTSALDIAAHDRHFTFDGTFDTEFDDFFITTIDGVAETATEFWGLLLNWQFTPVGGCQQEVENDDYILWAFNAFNLVHFLKLTGPGWTEVHHPITVHVTDGSTGQNIPGATVEGETTSAEGTASITFARQGVYNFKATLPGSLRSNALEVIVV